MTEIRKDILRHFEEIAPQYDAYKQHSSYYYQQLQQLYHDLIATPATRTILEIGCGTGAILASLDPRFGLGVDISPNMIELAAAKYRDRSNLQFLVAEAERFSDQRRFEVVIVPDVIEHLYDPAQALAAMTSLMEPQGVLIISMANQSWEPILDVLEKLRLKMPEGPHTWISAQNLAAMITANNLEISEQGYRCLIPARIPLIADLCNARFYRRRWLARLGLIYYVVARFRQARERDDRGCVHKSH